MSSTAAIEREKQAATALARLEKRPQPIDDAQVEPPLKKQKLTEPTASFQGTHVSIQTPQSDNSTAGIRDSQGPAHLSPSGTLKYPHGILRLTRTPGRNDETPGRRKCNTVLPEELIHSDLVKGYFNCFQHSEWLRYLEALPRSATIYHSCYFRVDPVAMEALAVSTGVVGFPAKVQSPEWYDSAVVAADTAYKARFGKNFHAVYPRECIKGTSPHSKIMLLEYPSYLRVVITSANFMEHNFTGSDNTWFIQDFPPLPPNSTHTPTPLAEDFETRFLNHIRTLGTDTASSFVDSFRNRFDFNAVKVSLIVSRPGTHGGVKSGEAGEEYGLLRLNRLVQENELQAKQSEVILESCTATTGNLKEEFLTTVHRAACGVLTSSGKGERKKLSKDDVVIVYPTRADVLASAAGERMAVEQGSIRAKAWADETTEVVKKMFHHYQSKDAGRLFHNKLIFPVRRDKPDEPPAWMYVGSANLSEAAWGKASPVSTKKKDEGKWKIAITSYECGVFIRGEDIGGMLEDGDWGEIIPYIRPSVPYDLEAKEKPWNSSAWVTGSTGKEKD